MPISSRLVAADAMRNCDASPAFSTRSFITNSAMGLRQMLPWHTNRMLVIYIFVSLLNDGIIKSSYSLTFLIGSLK